MRKPTPGFCVVGLVVLAVTILITGLALGWWAGKQTAPQLKNDAVQANSVGQTRKGAQVAAQTWGNVCNGVVSTTFVPFAGDQAGQAQSLVDAYGNHSQCTVAIQNTKKYSKAVLCAIVVHEYGHLVGKGHSKDPTNIMYFKITKKNIPAGCRGKG